MNQREIEKFKSLLIQLSRKGCGVHCSDLGLEGKIISVGFKPLWTNPVDSKIEKLVLYVADNTGIIRSASLSNIVGYDVISFDGKVMENAKKISLDARVFSSERPGDEKPYVKVRIDLELLEEKN